MRGNGAKTPGVTHPSHVLSLRPGDIVEVRSETEILATLDGQGAIDAMPFMPEMLRYCGRRFRVQSRADKTCDTVTKTGGRRLYHTVHLDTRCDGSGHGGCHAACLLFWKEAWLKRADSVGEADAAPAGGCTLVQLERAACRPDPENPASPVYSCQATRLVDATTKLKWWDARQYLRDVRTGNARAGKAVFLLARAMVNAIQRKRGGRQFPSGRPPTRTKTPHEVLDLQPGELVQVRTLEEITDTLDVGEKNRGLRFDVEMIRWCGGTFRVQSRVERIINEQTGRMMKMPTPSIILEGVACAAECSRGRLMCPRALPHFWREIWLRRVPKEATRTPVPDSTDHTYAVSARR